MENKYNKNTVASKLLLDGIHEESKLCKLIDFLNVDLSNNNLMCRENGIMMFGTLCDHDSYFMCEHRLQFIIDFVKNNFTEK